MAFFRRHSGFRAAAFATASRTRRVLSSGLNHAVQACGSMVACLSSGPRWRATNGRRTDLRGHRVGALASAPDKRRDLRRCRAVRCLLRPVTVAAGRGPDRFRRPVTRATSPQAARQPGVLRRRGTRERCGQPSAGCLRGSCQRGSARDNRLAAALDIASLSVAQLKAPSREGD